VIENGQNFEGRCPASSVKFSSRRLQPWLFGVLWLSIDRVVSHGQKGRSNPNDAGAFVFDTEVVPKPGSGTHFETRCPNWAEPIETIDRSQKLKEQRDDQDNETQYV
jgi:hypothetical protein